MVGILSCMLQPPSSILANYLIHLFKASALMMIQSIVYLILQKEKPLSSNYKQISLLETNLENLSMPFSTSCMRKQYFLLLCCYTVLSLKTAKIMSLSICAAKVSTIMSLFIALMSILDAAERKPYKLGMNSNLFESWQNLMFMK